MGRNGERHPPSPGTKSHSAIEEMTPKLSLCFVRGRRDIPGRRRGKAERHKMETWPVQSGVVGWSTCFQSRDVGRGWIPEHAECHAKEQTLSVDNGDGHGGPRSRGITYSDLDLRTCLAAK